MSLCSEAKWEAWGSLRYKAKLIAQAFSQYPSIDYEDVYSLVMDIITFRYFITLVVSKKSDAAHVVNAYMGI